MAATNPPVRVLYAMAFSLLALAQVAIAAAPGEVEYAQGVGTVQKPGQPAQILGKGVGIDQGDTITTGGTSYAIVKFSDGTRMTVRPGTQMVVQTYQFKPAAPENESAGSMVFNLIRGGLRTITGIIPKRDTSAAQVRTPTATVGIRGTDFDVRLCGQDCGSEQQALAGRSVTHPTAIQASARVVQLQGSVVTVGTNGTRHLVASGGPVYPGDTVETGANSYAVLVFRDETKMTVQPASRFAVEDFVYDPKAPQEGRFLVNLLKGGLRAFTGLIGKADHDHVGMRTATATVGIRGTGVDLQCTGTCAGEPDAGATDGLTVSVWDGSITLASAGGACGGGGGGSVGVSSGQSGNFSKCGKPPAVVGGVLNFTTPRPDTITVDMQRLFGLDVTSGGQAGLWVLVRDGHVSIETGDQILNLARGESGFTDGTLLLRPLSIPQFLELDSTPLPNGGNLAQGLLGLIQSTGVNAQCQR